jgi:hypothetical protein
MTRISSEEALLDEALLSPELAPFAMFNVEVPLTGGMTTDLWHFTSNEGSTMHHLRDHKRVLRAAYDIAHRERVNLMAIRVAIGLPPCKGDTFEGNDDPRLDMNEDGTPQNEWAHFWGGDSPTERMKWVGEE